MIPRFSPDYRLRDIVHSFLPVPSDSVTRLERAFVRRTGHSDAIALKYGRAGLYFLLKALGYQGKKVVIPSYTCVVVAHAIVLSGNEPVFLDNAPGRFQPDPLDYLAKVAEDPEGTVMIIPTHLFGIVEETADLYQQIRMQYPHVFVMQDCAHGYFGRDTSGKVVTAYGDGAIFGMNISKLVNSVRGGMLTLRDEALCQSVREIIRQERMYYSAKESDFTSNFKARLYTLAASGAFTSLGYGLVYWLTRNTSLLSGETDYYHENSIEMPADFRSSMLPFEAAIGLASLARYDQRIHLRRRLAQCYAEHLAPLRRARKLYFIDPQPGDTWSHFPVLVPEALRQSVIQRIEREVNTEVGVIVDYSVADLLAYKTRGHTGAREAAQTVPRVLNLPLTFYEVSLGFTGVIKDATIQAKISHIVDILNETLA